MVPSAAVSQTKSNPVPASSLATVTSSALASLRVGNARALEALVLELADTPQRPEVTDAVAVLRSGLAAVQDLARVSPVLASADDLLRELLLGLPLIHAAQAGPRSAALTSLAVPAVSGSRGSLWRLSRAVLAVESGHPGQLRRLRDQAASYRTGAFIVDCATRRENDDWATWLAVLARLAWVTEDLQLCELTVDALAELSSELVVLGGLIPLGPVGWFIAQPLELLGRYREAAAANRAAEQVSWALGSARWVARCRLQRRFLTDRGLDLLGQDRPSLRSDSVAAPAVSEPVAAPAVSDSVAAPAVSEPASSPQASPLVLGLSKRQLEILRMAASGLTNVQIAAELFVSVATVERHSTITYRKLGVRNRAQALGLLGHPTNAQWAQLLAERDPR